MEDIHIDDQVVSKWIIKKYNRKAWNQLIGLWVGPSGRLL